jgi:hypothetical protein
MEVKRRIVLLASVLLAVAAGCGSPGSPLPSGPVGPQTEGRSAQVSDTGDPTNVTDSNERPPEPICSLANIHVSQGGTQPLAGTIWQVIVLTNTGGRTCNIRGYPTLSFRDASGRQVGSAKRNGVPVSPGHDYPSNPKAPIVNLPAGRSASALISYFIAYNIEEGRCPEYATAWFYLPGDHHSVHLPYLDANSTDGTPGGKQWICESRISTVAPGVVDISH